MWNSDCYYSCVGSTVSETMTGHERKRQSLSGKRGDAARQNRAFHHSAAKVVLLYSPPPWQSLTSVSYLKQKCNALPPTPPLPLPLSLTEESLRSTWEKAPELRGWFYFFFPTWNGLDAGAARPFPSTSSYWWQNKLFNCHFLKRWKLESV